MIRARRWLVFTAMGLWVASSLSTAQISPHRSHKIPLKQAPLTPLPSGSLSQLPMDQIPAAPPHVSYQHGLLTIVARNSTLADILLEVGKVTGASISVPPNATERVVTQLGPGPARDVLAGLLNGTSFNYVMVGSPSDPAALSALLLTLKPAGGSGVPTNTSVAMTDQSNPAFTPAERVPPLVAGQPGNPTEDDAEADDSDDEPGTQGAANSGAPPVGQEQGMTAEERMQQLREKVKLPPGFQPPLIVAPPNAPNRPE